MRIGVFLGSGILGTGVSGLLEEVAEAEKAGFDSLWFAQVFGLDVLTLISIAGAVTSRIELGTAVVPTFPRHPLVMAQQAMTAQAATDGRLSLGIGLSHKVVIEDMLGLSFDRPARHMLEYLSVLRALVNDGAVDFEGEAYRVSATVQLPDVAPCPILVAALGPRMLKVAGEHSDGTITWMAGPKGLASNIVPQIGEAAKNAGRGPLRVCVGLPIAVTDDPEATREVLKHDLRFYGRLPSYRRLLDIEGVADPSDVAVIGDEAEVERQLRALADTGATDLLAMEYPTGEEHVESRARLRTLLKGLVGKI